jgi:hypothetical protein
MDLALYGTPEAFGTLTSANGCASRMWIPKVQAVVDAQAMSARHQDFVQGVRP